MRGNPGTRWPADSRLLFALLLAAGLLVLNRTRVEEPEGREDARAPSASLFDGRSLPTFELTLPESSYRNLAADPFVYQPADFTYRSPSDVRDNIVLRSVGVRLKGQGSFLHIRAKPALKIRFDKYVKSQHLLGLGRLTLNNMNQDPSKVRERLAFHFFRRAGLVVPRCNSARVFLNGRYYGLYANVETIDRVFVQTHFDLPPGNLYEPSRGRWSGVESRWMQSLELETNRARNDRSDLAELIRMISGPHGGFVSAAESVVDLDQWLAVGAGQAIMADWDGYFGARNNYKLYRNLGRDRFLLLPWGLDNTFGNHLGSFRHLRYPIDGSQSYRTNGLLFRRCRATPACYERYLGHVEKALQLWEGLDLPAELERILEQITPSVRKDKRRGCSYEEFERAVENVRRFLLRRGQIVRLDLERERTGLAGRPGT